MALNLLLSPAMGNNTDRWRYLMEALPPAEYLTLSYYERWLHSILERLAETNAVPAELLDDIRQGNVAPAEQANSSEGKDANELAALFMHNTPKPVARAAQARFKTGDFVRGRTLHSVGHTRLPRYVRGRVGEIIADNGDFTFADDHARLIPAAQQRVYTVRFNARELWGTTANERDAVNLDLSDSYLEPI
ncbi:MAG: SH3-like domain-containing protein [Pseudomonadota bacterium]